MKGCAVNRFPWLCKSTMGYSCCYTHVTTHAHTHTHACAGALCPLHGPPSTVAVTSAPSRLDPVQGTQHHTPLHPVKGHSGLFSENAVPASELPPRKCQGVVGMWILVGQRHGHLGTLCWSVSLRDHHPGGCGPSTGAQGQHGHSAVLLLTHPV